MIFAFQVLPTIIFIAALFAILYYFGVMQIVVRLFAVADAPGDEARAAPSRSTSPPASSWGRPRRR